MQPHHTILLLLLLPGLTSLAFGDFDTKQVPAGSGTRINKGFWRQGKGSLSKDPAEPSRIDSSWVFLGRQRPLLPSLLSAARTPYEANKWYSVYSPTEADAHRVSSSLEIWHMWYIIATRDQLWIGYHEEHAYFTLSCSELYSNGRMFGSLNA